ncbi:DUF4440 domain-containing protein [Martelella mediterranea]|uniref:DUF4440 domain-containing protein n=1 Tax=Martelella mediterranea TaxID=293089 RepID=UPI001E30F504|nr:DUF4440 domain-containing protein [Martelella mediterranea]MCD1634382.1 DUF4440 domain-containing protein [Martelella mediterranea]
MTDSKRASFTAMAEKEPDALHRQLQAWFRAEGTEDAEAVLHCFEPGYQMVGAAGNVVSIEAMHVGFPKQRGSRPTLIMEISDVEIRHVEGKTALVRYKERQIQDTGTNDRWAAAVLVDRGEGKRPGWLFLQETFCP